MRLADLTKDVRRLLLAHWSIEEIEDRLKDPDYFFDQVVIPRLNYLKESGEDVPRMRVGRTPDGGWRVVLNP